MAATCPLLSKGKASIATLSRSLSTVFTTPDIHAVRPHYKARSSAYQDLLLKSLAHLFRADYDDAAVPSIQMISNLAWPPATRNSLRQPPCDLRSAGPVGPTFGFGRRVSYK